MNIQSKNLAIVVLFLTAVVLLSTLLLVSHLPVREAKAVGPIDRQGDYIMLPGNTQRSGAQVVFVIDLAARKVAVYTADFSKGEITARASFELSRLPEK